MCMSSNLVLHTQEEQLAKQLVKDQAKPQYQKEDGTVMTAEEIAAAKAAMYEAAGGKDAFKAKKKAEKEAAKDAEKAVRLEAPCLPACLPVSLPACLPIYLLVCIPACLPCMPACLPACNDLGSGCCFSCTGQAIS